MLKILYCPQNAPLQVIRCDNIFFNEMIMIHPKYYLCYIKNIHDYNWRYIYDDLNNKTLLSSAYYVPGDAIIIKQLESDYENCFKRVDIDDEFVNNLQQILNASRRRPRVFCKNKPKFWICNNCCVVKEWIKLEFF